MKRARGDDEEVAMTSGTYLEARDALVALLREYGKDDQAAALMRGELTELRLYDCQIGDDGAKIVADFLKHNRTLLEVFLYTCNIGPREAKAIAESLKHNKTIELLHLGDNPIGGEGAEALIEALNLNVCIEFLTVTDESAGPQLLATIKYLTETRNFALIPAAVRRTSLYLIAARCNIAGAGILAIFPKEIVRMIAMEVYATRKDPIWINALTESERMGRSAWCCIQ